MKLLPLPTSIALLQAATRSAAFSFVPPLPPSFDTRRDKLQLIPLSPPKLSPHPLLRSSTLSSTHKRDDATLSQETITSNNNITDSSSSNKKEAETACNFWGKPRNKQEIIEFVSNAVFSNNGEEEEQQQQQQLQQSQDQWVEVISEEPPLILIHGFLEHDYCDDIVQAVTSPEDDPDPPGNNNSINDGNNNTGSNNTTIQQTTKPKLQRSTMGAQQSTSNERTSSTAWLREEHMQSSNSNDDDDNNNNNNNNNDRITTPLPLWTFATRVSQLSGMPTSHMENLQVVRYTVGEEFQMHTDHLDSFNEYEVGGRLATCLVYLNDAATAIRNNETEKATAITNDNNAADPFTGGETFFHEFNIAIPPKKGSAVFFWNTLERPGSEGYDGSMFLNVDTKLRHAGLPVLSGEKWIANRWIHPVDFGAGVRGL